MELKKRVVIAICLLLAGIFACSRKTTIPTQVTYTPVPVFPNLDSILANTEICFAFYKSRPVKFYEPPLCIRDSFSKYEQSLVGIPDDQLFARRQELIINFDQIADGAFCFPLPGARILSTFGPRNGRRHTGYDLKVSTHDTIVAAFDGIVRMAGSTRGYGNVIVVRHYNGLETVYAHNSKHLVHSGQHVTAGTPLSLSGDTGRATTDHLHFEVRIDGKPFDPSLIIDFHSQTLLHQSLVFSPDEKGNIQIESV